MMRFPVRLVYVCGPITAKTKEQRDANIETGRAVGFDVWRLGAMAIVPHLNSLSMFERGVDGAAIYLGDLELMKRCDAVLVLDGWQASFGCNLEVSWANHNGMPVFFDLKGLGAWLGEKSPLAHALYGPRDECQAHYGADDVCGLPSDSRIHKDHVEGHPFVPVRTGAEQDGE